MVREELRDGFKFVPMFNPFYIKDAIKVAVNFRSLEEYRDYILEHNIEKAEIVMPDLKILQLCPQLKYLRIHPSYNAPEKFDFSPLYEMPEVRALNCINVHGMSAQYISDVDYSRINGLVSLSVGVNKGTLNFNKVETLKSLKAGGFKGRQRDLTDLFCSRDLDTLTLIECGIHSLNGIETSQKMQCLYLHYNRTLNDISALRKVKGTLKALRIENCPKITDFSVLEELENLELLELSGSNTLPNLDFLNNLKNLKLFCFSMNVLDGNLSPCLSIACVDSFKNRKHYNLKDCELPKGKCKMGNEDIEQWRRLE